MSRLSCREEVAPLRAEPDDGAEQFSQLLLGEPVRVLEERDGWAWVEPAYASPGGVRTAALAESDGDEWLPSRGGDPLAEARRYLGSPYEWGGMTERGIDCSGLVHMAFRRCGLLVPRDADEQEEAGQEVAETDLRPGDLVCYEGHIAFWAGNGTILHATGREGVHAVVEEPHPPELAARARRYVRLGARESLEGG